MSADFIANILFPPVCVACRARIGRGAVCESCFSGIELNSALMCGECHMGLAVDGRFTSSCHPNFPFILGGAAAYENPVLQSLIHHLKFRSISIAAEPLGDLLYSYAARLQLDLSDFVVMPIPLSRRRRRARGYNQAELIARRFAWLAGLPLDTSILIRARHAKPQSDILNIAARRENIRGVFAITDSPAAHGNLCGENIILIDDVSTTGSTFCEAALVLKAAGAAQVLALAVAKT